MSRVPRQARGLLAPGAHEGDPSEYWERRMPSRGVTAEVVRKFARRSPRATPQSHHRPEEPKHGASSSSCCLCASLCGNDDAAHRLQDAGGRCDSGSGSRGIGGPASALGHRRGSGAVRHRDRDGDGAASGTAGGLRHASPCAPRSHRATTPTGTARLRLLRARLLPMGRTPLPLGARALGPPARPRLRPRALDARSARPRLDRRPLGVEALERRASSSTRGVSSRRPPSFREPGPKIRGPECERGFLQRTQGNEGNESASRDRRSRSLIGGGRTEEERALR
jgi:hypothetical protein